MGALLRVRREKLDQLRALGVDPFGEGFETTHSPAALREAFAEGMAVRVAGRITALRDMGKSNFLDL
ncbi:MAG TPA: lysine--tRNA ligase, partial [Bacteroidia bacterium]|nr:lysine--tRNA ligase [Bacteroidia bacterium]